MSSFVKLVAVLSTGLLATAMAVEKPIDDKTPKAESKDSGEKSKDAAGKSGEKKSKKDKKKDKPVDPDAPHKAIDIPMPNGHDAKGIKIPYRDGDGKLKMRFDIGVATRIDENHIQMSDLQIETFDDEGEHEMSMDLPTSVLDLNTSVLTAQKAVRIKREDFELTGNVMIFNTRTKQGGLGGNVRMLIYNLENETESSSDTPEPKAK